MTAHPSLRGRPALAVLASVAAVAVAAAAFALLGGSPGRAFPTLVPAAAPAGWPHRTLPNGTAVLSYPPSLHPVRGDADAVSAAQVSPRGASGSTSTPHPGKATSSCAAGPRSGWLC